MPFDADIALTERDGALHGAVAEGWDTPRGPLGGYVMAIVLNGMQIAVADAAAPAALAHRPLPPPAPRRPGDRPPHVERTGRSLTTVTARLEQDGKMIALALGAFSTPWESPLLERRADARRRRRPTRRGPPSPSIAPDRPRRTSPSA